MRSTEARQERGVEAGTSRRLRSGDRVGAAPAGAIRVLIVDEHRMFGEALSRFLAGEEGVAWTAAATSPDEAFALCRAHEPHVVLIGVSFLDGYGTERLRELRREFGGTRVLIVTPTATRGSVAGALEAGASGCVLSTDPPDRLVELVRRAAAGEIVLPESQVAAVVRRLDDDRGKLAGRGMMPRLTAREREVLEKLADGRSTEEVAGELHVSPLTVRSHVKSILAKLGVHSKLQAVTYALRNGLVGAPGLERP